MPSKAHFWSLILRPRQSTGNAAPHNALELVGGETTVHPHLIARILKRTALYNPRWSYHTSPDSTHFFDQATEVCDATVPYVEEHLDEVGSAFLPGLIWCDWSSRLVREIPAP
ncbi:BP74-related protein [Streptacidiphilus anmyonensis]|uniref:BP74-related protein n=1 Tax=Streptacidiphilus anmyonensis TaxID=405782 RepID=UPI00069347D5|nr:hypothetical protein [Streptacidiphilus anmyonensis]